MDKYTTDMSTPALARSMDPIKFAAGLPISGVVRIGDRYVAGFVSDDIRAQFTSSEAPWGEAPWWCLLDAGFQWDHVDRQWWTTLNPGLPQRLHVGRAN